MPAVRIINNIDVHSTNMLARPMTIVIRCFFHMGVITRTPLVNLLN